MDVFTPTSWFYVLDGMGVAPKAWDPIVDVADFAKVCRALGEIRADVEAAVARAKPMREVLEATVARGW